MPVRKPYSHQKTTAALYYISKCAGELDFFSLYLMKRKGLTIGADEEIQYEDALKRVFIRSPSFLQQRESMKEKSCLVSFWTLEKNVRGLRVRYFS